MSLGWLTESSLMPKRAKEIEQVGKATMVDLRAQLYRSEESLKHTESGASAAAALSADRRKRDRRTDVLGAGRNTGVCQRSATDAAAERDSAALSQEAMARKVEAYEAMARGECVEGKDSLVDFELKQLRGSDEAEADPTLVSADMDRESQRVQWEAAAVAEGGGGSGGGGGGGGGGRLPRHEQRRSAQEKRLAHELSEETEQGRSSAADQKLKRQRALEERRAMIRLRNESRRRAQEEIAGAQGEIDGAQREITGAQREIGRGGEVPGDREVDPRPVATAPAPTAALGSVASGAQPWRTSTAHLPSTVALETSMAESPQTTTLETAAAGQPTLAAICSSALA